MESVTPRIWGRRAAWGSDVHLETGPLVGLIDILCLKMSLSINNQSDVNPIFLLMLKRHKCFTDRITTFKSYYFIQTLGCG